MSYLELVQNVALLVSLVVIHGLIMRRWSKDTFRSQAFSGFLFGCVALIGMMTPVHLMPGVIFDGRSVVLCVAGFFGGPLVAGIAAVMSAAYRLWLGGPGALIGVIVILESAGLGVAFYYLRRRYPVLTRNLYLFAFGLLVHVGMLLLMLALPREAMIKTLEQIAMPVLLIYPAATWMVCLLFLDQEVHVSAEEDIRESEKRYKTVANYTYDWEYWIDDDGNFLYCSPSCERITGYSAKEFFDDPDLMNRIIHPDDRNVMQSHYHQARKENPHAIETTDFRIIHRDGDTRWIGHVCQLVYGQEGQPLGRRGSNRDMTERKQAVEKLIASEERYRCLLTHLDAGVVVHTADTSVIMNNPRASALLGLSDDHMRGKLAIDPEWKFLKENRTPLPIEEYPVNQIISNRKSIKDFVLGINRPATNDVAWVSVNGFPVIDSKGEISEIVISFIDITEKKRTEEALRESEVKYRTIFNNAAVGIMLVAESGRFMQVNSTLKDMLGYTDEEIKTLSVFDITPPEDIRISKEKLESLKNGATSSYRLEKRYVRKDGALLWVDLFVSTIKDSDGCPIATIGVISDITQRKQAERRQHMTSEVLGILNNTSDLTDSIKLILDVIKQETDVDAVGIRLRSGDDFLYFVQSGFSQDFLFTENTLIVQDASGPCRDENGNIRLACTCGLVLSGPSDATSSLFTEGGSIWTNDSRLFLDIPAEQDPRFHPRNKCVHQGFLSVSLIPIRANREIVGLLQLNDRKKDCFTLDMIHFFEGITASIGVALLRKQAEDNLRLSEEQFSKAFHLNPDAILMIRVVDGIIVSANEGFQEILGYTEDELIGKSAREINIWDNPEDRNRWTENLKTEGKVANFEAPFRTKDGDIRYGLISASTIEFNREPHILTVARDITERKQSEETNLRIAAIVESSDDAIIGKTVDGIITSWNKGAENIYGYKEHEVIGKPITILSPHGREKEIQDILERIKGGESFRSLETVRRKKDGDNVHISLTMSPIIDKKDNIIGVSTTFRDISDRVKTAQERQSLQEQLLQSQKMEAVGTLAGGIAHDFNNLLQVVLGYSEVMLLRKKEGEHDYADIQNIYQAGKRGADLVERLMTFSRKVETQYVPMDFNQEIVTVRDLLFNTIPKTITIDLHLSENLTTIQADRSQISQILMNLGVNARDAMPDGGTLTIETANIQLDEEYCGIHPETKPGDYVLLTVSDTGQGMDKETLSHIFEPFFTTKEQGKGTGLGLATVYGIVKHHEGYINCNSQFGHGTTFNIYLPTSQTNQILETSPIETTTPGGNETILLVEDDNLIRKLCAELLVGVGYNVISTGNGKEALEIYQMEKHKISLILLDLIMPVMDGWQCLVKILRVDPNAKVIIASGLAKGMQAKGAKGFVQKPFESSQLLTTIRNVLDKD